MSDTFYPDQLASAYYDIMARLVFYRKMYEYDTAASGNPMWVAEVLHIWELLEQMVPEMEEHGLDVPHRKYYRYIWANADGKRSDVYVQAALAGNLPDDFDDQDAAYRLGELSEEPDIALMPSGEKDFLIMNGAIVGTRTLFRMLLQVVRVFWD
ncbi:hypothetical protein B0H21DRAFT_710655 [Amylocystis lapponica]|nr:hypothetical protein B0H21DRAFT_710655 [Amylocystis lapponica]